jgi:hypothetical protein
VTLTRGSIQVGSRSGRGVETSRWMAVRELSRGSGGRHIGSRSYGTHESFTEWYESGLSGGRHVFAAVGMNPLPILRRCSASSRGACSFSASLTRYS